MGCGEGLLAAKLRAVMPEVTGIDHDAGCIAVARADQGRAGLDFLPGDILTADLEPASFDFVSCVAALHHLDASAGLRRMRDLLRPGGRLVVIGCARTASAADAGAVLASVAAHQILSRRRSWAESAAPVVWPPPVSYGEMRRLAGPSCPARPSGAGCCGGIR